MKADIISPQVSMPGKIKPKLCWLSEANLKVDFMTSENVNVFNFVLPQLSNCNSGS